MGGLPAKMRVHPDNTLVIQFVILSTHALRAAGMEQEHPP